MIGVGNASRWSTFLILGTWPLAMYLGCRLLGLSVGTAIVAAALAPLVASIREVAASADPATRTYAVKAAIEGGDAPPLGATVTVFPQALSAQGASAITLPTTALMKGSDGTSVWVFDAGTSTVRAQPVSIATADGNSAVIASGITPGMQVVATGVHVLSPGQKVSIYEDKYGVAPSGKAQAAIKNEAADQAVAPTGAGARP